MKKIDGIIGQLNRNPLTRIDGGIEKALRKVELRGFLQEEFRGQAYGDFNRAVPFFKDSHIIKTVPALAAVSVYLKNLPLKKSKKILVLGSKSGYIAALMAEINKELQIYIIEKYRPVFDWTVRNKIRNGYERNITVVCADPLTGLPEKAPFDCVLVTGMVEREDLKEIKKQVAEGGRIICPLTLSLSHEGRGKGIGGADMKNPPLSPFFKGGGNALSDYPRGSNALSVTNTKEPAALMLMTRRGKDFSEEKLFSGNFKTLKYDVVDREFWRLDIFNVEDRYIWDIEGPGHYVAKFCANMIVKNEIKRDVLGVVTGRNEEGRNAQGNRPNPPAPFAKGGLYSETKASRYGENREFGDVKGAGFLTGKEVQALGDDIFLRLTPVEAREYIKKLPPESFVYISSTDQSVPWELMRFNDEMLCLKHICARRVSTPFFNERFFKKDARSGNPPKVLLAGSSAGNLPEVKKEIEGIAKALSEKRIFDKENIFVLAGKDLNSVNFSRLCAKHEFDIFHFAGHSAFDPEKPERSSIILTDKSRWTADELQNVFRKTPQIVFLNSCEATKKGGGSAIGAAGITGLSDPFIKWGVKAFLGPLWGVESLPAIDFAVDFYRQLVLEGLTIGEAVRESRLALKQKYKSKDATSAYAAYVLYANPNYRLKISEY